MLPMANLIETSSTTIHFSNRFSETILWPTHNDHSTFRFFVRKVAESTWILNKNEMLIQLFFLTKRRDSKLSTLILLFDRQIITV